MARRSVLIAIVALVLVTWVLISSINTLQTPIQNSNSNGNTGNTGKTGNPNSKGTGNTTGNGQSRSVLIGNFTFPSLTAPNIHLNLSFLNILYKFLVALYHLLSPLFILLHYLLYFIAYLADFLVKLLLDLLAFLHIHITRLGIHNNLLNQSRSGSGGPNGATKSSPYQLPYVITYIVIGLMVAIVALTGVSAVSRKKKSTSGGNELLPEDVVLSQLDLEAGIEDLFVPLNVRSGKFMGWSSGNDLINPDIPQDLPLIYPAGMPLSVHMRTNAEFRGNYDLIENNKSQDYRISLHEGCTETSADTGSEKEKKIFRGVNVRDEISLLLKLNLAAGISAESRFRTVREIILSEELRKIIVSDSKLHEMIRSYERAYYGLKETELGEFQRFLYCIRDTFADARIAVCGT